VWYMLRAYIHSIFLCFVDGLEYKICTEVPVEMFNAKCLYWKTDKCYLLVYVSFQNPHKPCCA
jgi:hypothetical protein